MLELSLTRQHLVSEGWGARDQSIALAVAHRPTAGPHMPKNRGSVSGPPDSFGRGFSGTYRSLLRVPDPELKLSAASPFTLYQ